MSAARRLLSYLRPHSTRCAWAIAAMCGVALFNGASILILKPIVDRVLIARDLRMLRLIVAGVPALVVLKTAASYAQNYLMSWLGQRVSQRIREDLFRHLHALPLAWYDSHESGDVLSRATGDLAAVQTALTSVPLYLIRDSGTVLILGCSLFYLDASFALLALLGLPLTAASFLILSRKMRSASRQTQRMMARLYQRFQESVHGMAVIRAFNYEEGVLAKFAEENESFFAPTMRYLRASALAGPLLELCGALVGAAILFFGGSEVIRGRMTPGAFFAFLGAFFAAYAPVKNLSRSNSELQRALASAERIFQLLDEPAAARPRPSAGPFPGLRRELLLDGVGFRYPGRADWVLRGIRLAIAKGERVAILGSSGSGKSTLGRLLLRLHEPTEGSLLCDGTDLRSYEPAALRAEVGLVSQHTLLFNDTVFENVSLGRRVVTLSEVERACALAGAADFVASLPEGYQARLGDWGASLSAGQRQRLGIARVVLKDPSLLVLDEATAGLDYAGERALWDSLEPLLAGRTVILLAHQLSRLPRVDRTLVLRGGRLLEDASAGALRESVT